MNRIVLLTAAASLFVLGCHKHASVQGPGMNDDREKKLLEMAKPTMGSCAEDQVTTTFMQSVEANYHEYQVTGCGLKYTALLHCTGPVCNWIEGPETMATVEMQCPVPQLSSTYANQVFTVSGCGRQKNYTLSHGKIEAQP